MRSFARRARSATGSFNISASRISRRLVTLAYRVGCGYSGPRWTDHYGTCPEPAEDSTTLAQTSVCIRMTDQVDRSERPPCTSPPRTAAPRTRAAAIAACARYAETPTDLPPTMAYASGTGKFLGLPSNLQAFELTAARASHTDLLPLLPMISHLFPNNLQSLLPMISNLSSRRHSMPSL